MTDHNRIARWALIAALLLASAGAFAQDDELRKTFFKEADAARAAADAADAKLLAPRSYSRGMDEYRDAEATRDLVRDGHPPVELVPNGVDCEQFRPGLAEPQPDTLIFGGALSYDANHEAMRFFLSQVYPHIRRECPGAQLSITGSHKGADLDSLSLDESVTLTGFVDDIRPVIARSWAAVVPLLSGGGTRIKVNMEFSPVQDRRWRQSVARGLIPA